MDPTDTFLIFADLVSAQTRSEQMATILGCNGLSTKYWYVIWPLTDGTFALQVQASGDFSTKPGPTALSQLTPLEIASLVPFVTIQPLLTAITLI